MGEQEQRERRKVRVRARGGLRRQKVVITYLFIVSSTASFVLQ